MIWNEVFPAVVYWKFSINQLGIAKEFEVHPVVGCSCAETSTPAAAARTSECERIMGLGFETGENCLGASSARTPVITYIPLETSVENINFGVFLYTVYLPLLPLTSLSFWKKRGRIVPQNQILTHCRPASTTW